VYVCVCLYASLEPYRLSPKSVERFESTPSVAILRSAARLAGKHDGV